MSNLAALIDMGGTFTKLSTMVSSSNDAPIEIAGDGGELYDTAMATKEFERKRQTQAEVTFLANPDYNNIHGLAYLHRSGRRHMSFMD